MTELQPGVGEFLVSVAALERGRAAPCILAVAVDRGVVTLDLDSGEAVTVRLGSGGEELVEVLSGAVGGVVPAVSTPKQFPTEPISPHEKWVELLDDLGGWYEMLGRMRPGLRLVSIRRDADLRAGAVARVTVTDGRRSAVTVVSLDDGLLVVGLPDDLATSFDALATPDPLDS